MIPSTVRLHIDKVKLSPAEIYSRRDAERARTVGGEGRLWWGFVHTICILFPLFLFPTQIDLILVTISARSHRLWHKNLSPIKPRSSRYSDYGVTPTALFLQS